MTTPRPTKLQEIVVKHRSILKTKEKLQKVINEYPFEEVTNVSQNYIKGGNENRSTRTSSLFSTKTSCEEQLTLREFKEKSALTNSTEEIFLQDVGSTGGVDFGDQEKANSRMSKTKSCNFYKMVADKFTRRPVNITPRMKTPESLNIRWTQKVTRIWIGTHRQKTPSPRYGEQTNWP